MSDVVFPITYTRTLAREQGLDHKGQLALLRGTRLSPSDLLELNTHMDAETQATIVRNALQLSGNPALGLRWGANLHLAAHGPLGTVIASSLTLGQAWKATEKFHDIRGGFARMEGHVAKDHFAVMISMAVPLDEVGRFFCEAVLATMVNHLGMIIGQSSPAIRIELAYAPPAHADEYANYLRTPCLFNRPHTKIVVPAGLALMPNPMADPETYALALARCEQLLLEQKRPKGWSVRVTEILRSNPGQLWTCEQVARHFHLSSRTLMRHLHDADTPQRPSGSCWSGRRPPGCCACPEGAGEELLRFCAWITFYQACRPPVQKTEGDMVIRARNSRVWVAGLPWNGWPVSRGMTGWFQWNTQLVRTSYLSISFIELFLMWPGQLLALRTYRFARLV